jgi:hypothetical protein
MSRVWNFSDHCAIVVTDGLATTATLTLATLLMVWFCGCASVGQYTAADAQKAAAIATAVGDSAGAACWPVLATTGTAISAAGDTPGILAGIEEKRALQMALQNINCQPVWAGVLAELLKATPAAPLLP